MKKFKYHLKTSEPTLIIQETLFDEMVDVVGSMKSLYLLKNNYILYYSAFIKKFRGLEYHYVF